MQLLCDLLRALAHLLYGQIYRNCSEIVVKFNWMFFQQKIAQTFFIGRCKTEK
jgi:hypothetical protein